MNERDTFLNADTDKWERVLTFMESMESSNTLFWRRMEEEALDEHIPVIRPGTQSLLKFFLTLQRPAHILEVGTGTGFSALLMLHYAPGETDLVTIEQDHGRYEKAQGNKDAAAKAGEIGDPARCRMLEGTAEDLLPQFPGETFDFIFMDAAKGQYIHFLPEVLRVLSPGGLLISDNIFKEGEILESRYAVKRRDRTIHKRMREYLYALTHNDALETLLLMEGDGAAVSVKKGSRT